jgi:transposase-like protein
MHTGSFKSEYTACPRCSAHDPNKVHWAWWGGAIGPALLAHVKCRSCGAEYNGRSGQPNTRGIMLYQLAGVVLVVLMLLAAVTLRPH